MANTSPSSSPSTATTPTTAIQDSIDKAKSFNIYLTLVNYKCNYYCSEVKMDYLNFQKWLHNSNKGQSFVYFKGYLAQEKSHANFEKEILRFTNTLMRLSEKGLISLVQKRLGVANYEYKAIKK